MGNRSPNTSSPVLPVLTHWDLKGGCKQRANCAICLSLEKTSQPSDTLGSSTVPHFLILQLKRLRVFAEDADDGDAALWPACGGALGRICSADVTTTFSPSGVFLLFFWLPLQSCCILLSFPGRLVAPRDLPLPECSMAISTHTLPTFLQMDCARVWRSLDILVVTGCFGSHDGHPHPGDPAG